jgi:hypothetical protein
MYKIKLAMVPLFIEMKISIHMYIYIHIQIHTYIVTENGQLCSSTGKLMGFFRSLTLTGRFFLPFSAWEGHGHGATVQQTHRTGAFDLSHLRKWFGPEISYTPKRKRKKPTENDGQRLQLG